MFLLETEWNFTKRFVGNFILLFWHHTVFSPSFANFSDMACKVDAFSVSKKHETSVCAKISLLLIKIKSKYRVNLQHL